MERSRIVQSRLDDDLFEKLRSICEIRGMKTSEYIRIAIRAAIDEEKTMYQKIIKRMQGDKK